VTRVPLARHGQTEWNVLGRRQDQLDSPLTPAGFDQARHAKTLAGVSLDAISVVAGTHKRADRGARKDHSLEVVDSFVLRHRIVGGA
jgi:broad specificity phosphatase PhoE